MAKLIPVACLVKELLVNYSQRPHGIKGKFSKLMTDKAAIARKDGGGEIIARIEGRFGRDIWGLGRFAGWGQSMLAHRINF